ncbi:FAD-dependent monooxygenase [Parasynechococcus sp.]|uniref:FAD-dependent monooxygenase n=1 Tax=Parasynechococcus sp. TaxID=3101203 RepID=UPI0037041168
MASTSPSIQITGAGPTGSLAALALAEQGCFVVLHDRLSAAELQSRSRAYAITHSSRRLLCRLGLWDLLRSDLVPFDRLDLRDQATQRRAVFRLDDLSVSNQRHGAIGWILDHRPLMALLLQRLAQHPSVQLSLAHNEPIPSSPSAVLEVAADGPRSSTRTSWGIGVWRWSYRQGCLTAKVVLRGVRSGTAFELFRPEGPMAVLPLGGETYQVVWSAPLDRCQQRAALPVAAFLDQLAGVLPRGVEPDLLLDQPAAFPQEWMLARRFSHGSGVLLGEAAHRCHPVGGQGLNLCWRDVEALAAVVRSGAVPARMARRYGRQRTIDVVLVGTATDALVRFFSNRLGVLLPLRWLAVEALARIGLLRRLSLRAMTDGPLQLLRSSPD